jgi:hypothetical protein
MTASNGESKRSLYAFLIEGRPVPLRMETKHTTEFGEARNMAAIQDQSIQLMVTSPS